MAQKKKSSNRRKPAVGRPSRQDLGLEPTVQKTLKVEKSVVEKLEAEHGSLSEALRVFAAQ
jgi:hypothetical protein